MDGVTIFMTALGLAMDAFAVSVCKGISLQRIKLSHALRFGVFFGAFQFAMPLLGWFLASSFAEYIQAYDHWIAFILLAFIGGKMFKEGCEDDGEEVCDEAEILSFRNMTVLAVATSIDAMAVGISFALIHVDVLSASAVIGVVAFALSAAGVLLGKKLGGVFQKGAEKFGGIVLILIGLRILIDHLFFGG